MVATIPLDNLSIGRRYTVYRIVKNHMVVAFASARYLGNIPNNETAILLELSDYTNTYSPLEIQMEKAKIVAYEEILTGDSFMFTELRDTLD